MTRRWRWWLELLSRREPATALALFRMAVALVMATTLLTMIWAGLVDVLWVDRAFGGMRSVDSGFWLLEWLGGPRPSVVWAMIGVALVACAAMTVGLGGRWSVLVAVWAYRSVSSIGSTAGGYDAVILNAAWLLFLSRSTATLSCDCRLRTGSWTSQEPVAAWPRYLAVFQLVVIYLATGLMKTSASWTFADGYSALYWFLQDPTWARFDMSWTAWVYPATQVATALVWHFETTAPIILLVFHYRDTADRSGRLRALFNRRDLRRYWAGFGVAMHLGIAVLLDMGPFSWITLSYYFCLWSPAEIDAAWSRLCGCLGYHASMAQGLSISLLLAVIACGGGETQGAVGAGGSGMVPTCAPGEALVGDVCTPAGVPVGACAEGFESDDRGGCRPILPVEMCGSGEMALPGELACRPVAPCGQGPWGDIPIDAGTEFVDGSYTGVSDGSQSAPWTTIMDAVIAAAPGALIAVTDGTYPEVVLNFAGRSFRLWGRCPERVTVAGAVNENAIAVNVADTEVHQIGVSGDNLGVFAYEADPILFDRMWLRDLDEGAVLVAQLVLEPTSVVLSNSLLERIGGVAITVLASTVEIDKSVVRDTFENAMVGTGRGVDIQDDPTSGAVSVVTMRSSIVERTREAGIGVFGSSLEMYASIVRSTDPYTSGQWGLGVAAQSTAAAATLVMDGVLVEDNHSFGVSVIDSHAEVRLTTITTTNAQQSNGGFGDGLSVLAALGPASGSIDRARIAAAERAGVVAFSGEVSLTRAALECNRIAIDGETPYGPFAIQDDGGNACWCGAEAGECRVSTSSLEAPSPFP